MKKLYHPIFTKSTKYGGGYFKKFYNFRIFLNFFADSLRIARGFPKPKNSFQTVYFFFGIWYNKRKLENKEIFSENALHVL